MPIFELLERPYCSMLRVEPWNASAGRWFAAYRPRHGYRWLLGNGVVDEFATVSSPIFIAPHALLGRIYNAGIGLAHKRDSDMALDLGWPPLCAGIDRAAEEIPSNVETDLLALMTESGATSATKPELSAMVGAYTVERWRFSNVVTVIGTDTPLLPQQLGHLCDADDAPLTIALATGNRVVRQSDHQPQDLRVASEETLSATIAVLRA